MILKAFLLERVTGDWSTSIFMKSRGEAVSGDACTASYQLVYRSYKRERCFIQNLTSCHYSFRRSLFSLCDFCVLCGLFSFLLFDANSSSRRSCASLRMTHCSSGSFTFYFFHFTLCQHYSLFILQSSYSLPYLCVLYVLFVLNLNSKLKIHNLPEGHLGFS